jgi:hypothetical protein
MITTIVPATTSSVGGRTRLRLVPVFAVTA